MRLFPLLSRARKQSDVERKAGNIGMDKAEGSVKPFYVN